MKGLLTWMNSRISLISDGRLVIGSRRATLRLEIALERQPLYPTWGDEQSEVEGRTV